MTLVEVYAWFPLVDPARIRPLFRADLGQLPQRRHLPRAARDERRAPGVALPRLRQADRAATTTSRSSPTCCSADARAAAARKMSPRYPLVELHRRAALARRSSRPSSSRCPTARRRSRALARLRRRLRALHGPASRRRSSTPSTCSCPTRSPSAAPFSASRRRRCAVCRSPQSLVGASCGFIGVWLPFIFLYKRVLGRTGHGPRRREAPRARGRVVRLAGRGLRALRAARSRARSTRSSLKVLGIEPKLPDVGARGHRRAREGRRRGRRRSEAGARRRSARRAARGRHACRSDRS